MMLTNLESSITGKEMELGRVDGWEKRDKEIGIPNKSKSQQGGNTIE